MTERRQIRRLFRVRLRTLLLALTGAAILAAFLAYRENERERKLVAEVQVLIAKLKPRSHTSFVDNRTRIDAMRRLGEVGARASDALPETRKAAKAKDPYFSVPAADAIAKITKPRSQLSQPLAIP